MNKTIYLKTLIERKDSLEGEMPCQLHVTCERNGFGVFLTGHETGVALIRWFPVYQRDAALEFAISTAPSSSKVLDLLAKELREPTPDEVAAK